MLVLEHQLGVDLLHTAILGRGYDTSGSAGTATVGMTVLYTMAMVFGYAVFHGLIAHLCIRGAIRYLRTEDTPLPPPSRPEPRYPKRRAAPVVVDGWGPTRRPHRPSSPVAARSRFRIGERPLLWKEVYHGAGTSAGWRFGPVYGSALGIGLVVLLLAFALASPEIWPMGRPFTLVAAYPFIRDGVNPTVRGLGILLAAAWCGGVAWRAAGCITRERQQRTLAGLLTLPIDPAVVLGAKWLGGPLRYRWLAYILLAVWTLGLLSGALHPAAVPLLAVATVVHVAFLTSLGVWLSLVSRTTLWAYLGMALMLLLMFVGPWVALLYVDLLGGSTPGEGWWDDFAQIGLNPPRSWWFLGFSWDDFRDDVLRMDALRETLGATLTGLAIYAVAAGALWLAACRRFRTEQPSAG
jgi:hypothetical protein